MIFHRGSGCRHYLDGSLVDVYWDTFHQCEIYLNVLMTWFVPFTECIQQVGVVRMKHSEIIEEAFQSCQDPIQLRFS